MTDQQKQRIIKLRAEGKQYKEIAEVLELSLGCVKMFMSRRKREGERRKCEMCGKKEREERRAQEALAREREMAREPLQVSHEQTLFEDDIIAEEISKETPHKDLPQKLKPWPIQSADSFMERVRKFKFSPNSEQRKYPAKVQRMMDQGLSSIVFGVFG